ncbi:MAG: 30S ribosomal protein S11 [Candidatus Pacebacteria bacterium]|nr:30S ribosomal protein S11 [Candidatus Paceibacterota bacterium]
MGKRRVITIGSKDKSGSKSLNRGKVSKTKRRSMAKGQVHIKSTYNNTVVTLTDLNGGVIAWSTAGLLGFKGAKKATPYAATNIVNSLLEKTKKVGLKEVDVFVKGIGSGRESAVRAIAANGLVISSITDMTPIPHNGCRPPKPRRM